LGGVTAFAHIVPPSNVALVEHDPIQLVIAPYLQQSEIYRAFYRDVYQNYLILDNGAFEKQLVSAEELAELAIEIGAHEVVLPDVFDDGPGTLERARETLAMGCFNTRSYRALMANHMGVPQGKTAHEYEETLAGMLQISGIKTIGFSYQCLATAYGTEDRAQVLERLNKKFRFDAYYDGGLRMFHALGGGYTMTDLAKHKFPWLRSVDGSIAAKVTLACGESWSVVRRNLLQRKLTEFPREADWLTRKADPVMLRGVMNYFSDQLK